MATKKIQCPYAHLTGKNVLVRTVTMIYSGRLVGVYPTELVLSDAAWIADAGRWTQAVSSAAFSEVEPYGIAPIVVGRGAVVDVCALGGDLPRSQK